MGGTLSCSSENQAALRLLFVTALSFCDRLVPRRRRRQGRDGGLDVTLSIAEAAARLKKKKKKSNAPSVGAAQVISSTNGSGSSAGIEGLILSPLLCGLRKIDG